MLGVFKTVNKILRVIFIGFVGIFAIAKIFNIKSEPETVNFVDDADRDNSEFDEIW
jgi:hypothetical protein